MGEERKGLRKQVLLYTACLMFFCGGCAFTGASDGGFAVNLGRGDCEQAYAGLENLKRALDDRDLFGYVILFTDSNCRFYDESLAQAYYSRMKSIYPESRYTAYAGYVMEQFARERTAGALNSETTGKLRLAQKKIQEKEAENSALSEALKKSEESYNKISDENRELNERIKALSKENENIRQQLEKMKEVDMKIGRKVIGK
ncbi:hypothetical protein [Seleniivibrio woodruffii]|uniref:hypothetical protein n=1 Tax=Seleniivibrio woodruffii TaxID=1078050 RepID=UPI0026EEC5C6|nr:hypothetical protein [Seleniivibrio woodruffii]